VTLGDYHRERAERYERELLEAVRRACAATDDGWNYSDAIAREAKMPPGKGMGPRLIPLRDKGLIESRRLRPDQPLQWRPR
jgi:hypothetical protein